MATTIKDLTSGDIHELTGSERCFLMPAQLRTYDMTAAAVIGVQDDRAEVVFTAPHPEVWTLPVGRLSDIKDGESVFVESSDGEVLDDRDAFVELGLTGKHSNTWWLSRVGGEEA